MVSYFFNLLFIFLSTVEKKKSLFYCYVTTASEITTPYLKETDALLLGLLCMPWVLFLMHCGNL